jgi:hypothetical protein
MWKTSLSPPERGSWIIARRPKSAVHFTAGNPDIVDLDILGQAE